MGDSLKPAQLDLETVSCPVCGPAPSRVWLEEGKPTRYLRCLRCGTIFASPRPSRAQRYAWLDDYFGLGAAATHNETTRRKALEREAALIGRHLSGGRMLDVGCDLGAFFAGFPQPAWERFGVEVSPSAAEYAARQYNAQVFPGTIHDARYAANFFDLVTMIDMFLHVDDPRAEFCETARILKPGGLLAMEMPGLAWAILRGRGPLCWLIDREWTRFRSDSTYLYWYSVGGLRSLLQQTGFKVIAVHVIASPESRHAWRNALTGAHHRLMTFAVDRAPSLLTWASKYLLLARREADAA